MSSRSGSAARDALARLHAALDDLLAQQDHLPEHDLPDLVEGLVAAGARVHAAELDAVAAFDSWGLAAASPHRTTSRWLEHRTRMSASQASAVAASARAVRDHLPATRDALAEAAISRQHVAAIVHVVKAVGAEHAVQAEPVLLQLARRSEPSVVRRATSHLHAVLDPDGAQAVLDRVYAKRGVTLSVVGNRAYLDGVIDVEAAETLLAALMPLMAPSPLDTRSAPQRRADALVDLARRALDAGDLPVLGGRRPHLSVVVDERAFCDGGAGATLPWTGAVVPTSTLQRLSCDGRISPVVARALQAGWQPLAVGRSSRTVTPAQLTALQVRDGGCVHPGCTRTAAFCDAHHVQHWSQGGATDLSNLVLLCRHHHRTLHSGHWQLATGPPGRVHGHVAVLARGHRVALQTAGDRSPPLGWSA
jgi:hypothetical protein